MTKIMEVLVNELEFTAASTNDKIRSIHPLLIQMLNSSASRLPPNLLDYELPSGCPNSCSNVVPRVKPCTTPPQ